MTEIAWKPIENKLIRNQSPYFDVAAAGVNVPCAEPAKHAAIKYALVLKLAEFSYRSVLPSFAGKSLLKSWLCQ